MLTGVGVGVGPGLTRRGSGVTADPGLVLLIDDDGAYLTDDDGAYLQEPA